MDAREDQLKRFAPGNLFGLVPMIFRSSFCWGLALCRRLFNFIIQNLSGQAIKQVNLGPPVHQGPLQVPTSYASLQNLELEAHEWSCDEGGMSSRANFTDNNGEKTWEDVVATPTIATQVRGPPKKMVSFDDRAQVINPSKDKKKKKKETKKLPSMERERDEEPKPMRSILKMGSNLNGEQASEQGKL